MKRHPNHGYLTVTDIPAIVMDAVAAGLDHHISLTPHAWRGVRSRLIHSCAAYLAIRATGEQGQHRTPTRWLVWSDTPVIEGEPWQRLRWPEVTRQLSIWLNLRRPEELDGTLDCCRKGAA